MASAPSPRGAAGARRGAVAARRHTRSKGATAACRAPPGDGRARATLGLGSSRRSSGASRSRSSGASRSRSEQPPSSRRSSLNWRRRRRRRGLEVGVALRNDLRGGGEEPKTLLKRAQDRERLGNKSGSRSWSKSGSRRGSTRGSRSGNKSWSRSTSGSGSRSFWIRRSSTEGAGAGAGGEVSEGGGE